MLKRDRAKGFTLIELILVVAIIGVISAIAIPSFLGQRRHAKIVGDAKANANVIRMALESRRAEIGIYGEKGDYEYTMQSGGDYSRPDTDIVPSFAPKGNSKMNYKITIEENGLVYEIAVSDPSQGNRVVLTANQTGEMKEVKK